MDLTNLTKEQLLAKCLELGLTKFKSKNKTELIKLIHSNNCFIKPPIEFIIEEKDEKIVDKPKEQIEFIIKEKVQTSLPKKKNKLNLLLKKILDHI